MATAPAAHVPDIVDNIYLLPVDEIAMGERLRPVDRNWASALGQIIAVEGLKTPIEVCRLPGKTGWTLVAGAHRLAAHVEQGFAYIKAIVVDADRVERLLREVSENLWRKDLNPLDRASFVARLVDLHKVRAGVDPAKDGRSASAQVRWQKALKDEASSANDTVSVAYGWSDEVAEQIGVSRRTIERDLLLHRRLSPANLFHLREVNHPVLGNAAQLKALAKLEAAKQIEVTDLLRHGVVKTVSDAIATLEQKPRQSAEDKRLSAFIGAFGRMGHAEKMGALKTLADIANGQGILIHFDDQRGSSGGFSAEGKERAAQ